MPILLFLVVITNAASIPDSPNTTQEPDMGLVELLFGSSCEAAGLIGIYGTAECAESATEYGWDYIAFRKSDYKDIVDGCSLRPTGELFSIRAATCQVGHGTPNWVPDYDGKADCMCTEWQPCLCKKPDARPSFTLQMDTCLEQDMLQIDDEAYCKLLAFGKGIVWKFFVAGNPDTPKGCSFSEENGGTLSLGACQTASCRKCSHENVCICDRGLPTATVRVSKEQTLKF